MSCSRTKQKRKRIPLIPTSLSDLPSEILTDIFSRVVQDVGVEGYFKLARVSTKAREIVKSPPVLQCIKYENSDVLYHERVELAFGLKTNYLAGERMIMQASQLQCPRAIYTECMLNMLKDEVDSEEWEKIDALKQRLSPQDMHWERT
ncbi:hypothetical protein CJ030_MR2G016994 [Morella rubra]|uniref:F-box domain-containing protein n=1 Tax=Morella rubra TaxID=262757 RepID=A0A6A1WHF5_9ROSI|nr:hypothetical protein CJ030_MR2G016994 [Morella rubra]